jgi:hypothetical protein
MPAMDKALARAFALRDRDETDVLGDLRQRFDLTASEAQAALVVARKLDRNPLLARNGNAADAEDGYEVVVTPYSEIEAQTTDWLWEGRIPTGALSLMVGTEGLGKTALGLALAAELTRGTLRGDLHGTPVNVALFTPEDDPARTIRTRLDAAGADLQRVVDVKMRKDSLDRGFSLPADTDKIARALVESDVRFAFADPLASMLDPRLNSWKDTDVRNALEPIVSVCAEHGITLLGTLHTNKSASTDPRQRGMGSAGWRQIPRAAFLVGLDPDDADGQDGSARCVAHTKHNLGPRTRTVRFALETRAVTVLGKAHDAVRATLGEECDVNAHAMLAAEAGHEDAGATKAEDAGRWLHALLEDGPKAQHAIRQAAEDAGHGWRTVERAKKELGVDAYQQKGVRGWSWKLPDQLLPL